MPIVNVCDVAPAGIVTVAGTVALGELLVSPISAPPSGAGAGMDTTPVSGRPPGTELSITDNASCPIVSEVVRVTPAALAVIVAVSADGAAPMAIANAAIV